MRLTLDTHTDSAGETNVRLKYAYLYLDIYFPHTGGLEVLGQGWHRTFGN